MAKLQVQSIKEKKKLENGSTVFQVMGLLDGDLDSVDMISQPQFAPKVGDVIEVDVEVTQWGKKAKRHRENTFKPGIGSERSPEVQDAIMRQHATTDALSYLGVKASSMKKEQFEEIDPSKVVRIAELFFDYYKNGLKQRDAVQVISENFDDIEQYLPEVE